MQSPSKCPECGELYMTRKLVILPCNHILHKKCYLKIYDNAIDTNISIQCPVCHEEVSCLRWMYKDSMCRLCSSRKNTKLKNKLKNK